MAFLVIGLVIAKEREKGQAVEVGDVGWGRDLEAALVETAESGKPILVLFQEVPG